MDRQMAILLALTMGAMPTAAYELGTLSFEMAALTYGMFITGTVLMIFYAITTS